MHTFWRGDGDKTHAFDAYTKKKPTSRCEMGPCVCSVSTRMVLRLRKVLELPAETGCPGILGEATFAAAVGTGPLGLDQVGVLPADAGQPAVIHRVVDLGAVVAAEGHGGVLVDLVRIDAGVVVVRRPGVLGDANAARDRDHDRTDGTRDTQTQRSGPFRGILAGPGARVVAVEVDAEGAILRRLGVE